jgi:hypothetical protein
MKVKCAWCGKDMSEKPPIENTATTHGICTQCQKTEIVERTQKFKNKRPK